MNSTATRPAFSFDAWLKQFSGYRLMARPVGLSSDNILVRVAAVARRHERHGVPAFYLHASWGDAAPYRIDANKAASNGGPWEFLIPTAAITRRIHVEWAREDEDGDYAALLALFRAYPEDAPLRVVAHIETAGRTALPGANYKAAGNRPIILDHSDFEASAWRTGWALIAANRAAGGFVPRGGSAPETPQQAAEHISVGVRRLARRTDPVAVERVTERLLKPLRERAGNAVQQVQGETGVCLVWHPGRFAQPEHLSVTWQQQEPQSPPDTGMENQGERTRHTTDSAKGVPDASTTPPPLSLLYWNAGAPALTRVPEHHPRIPDPAAAWAAIEALLERIPSTPSDSHLKTQPEINHAV